MDQCIIEFWHKIFCHGFEHLKVSSIPTACSKGIIPIQCALLSSLGIMSYVLDLLLEIVSVCSGRCFFIPSLELF